MLQRNWRCIDMKNTRQNRSKTIYRGLLVAAMSLFAIQQPTWSVDRSDLISPQFNMQGARMISLGGTNPAISGDVNAVWINPATLGDIEFIQLGVTQQQIFSEFDYKALTFAYPFQAFTVSAAFGSDMLHGIPTTTFNNGVISEVEGGDFSSGFNVLQLGIGKTTYVDLFLVDKLSYGAALKGLQHVLGGNSRMSYGLDAGVSGTFYIPGTPLTFEKANVAVSGINLIATDLPAWLDSNAQPIGRQLFIGSSFEAMKDRLKLYANAYFISEFEEFSYGAEYYLIPSLVLRGSSVSNRANPSSFKHNLGMGLIFDRVAGVG
jgi:hypothetical protein